MKWKEIVKKKPSHRTEKKKPVEETCGAQRLFSFLENTRVGTPESGR